MTVTYRRQSPTLFTEARYAVWYLNETSMRFGASLAAGLSTIPSAAPPRCATIADCGGVNYSLP